jgi:hypothetical protein
MIAASRHYSGFMVDSSRWERFLFRPDDVVITTPSKCGTAWMQNIVGMLLLGRTDLGAPLSTLSPWLDMLLYSDDEVFARLQSQTHRRFMKTHTPLDGVPRLDSVTYIAMARHPLDVALSDLDHQQNMRAERAAELRRTAAGLSERAPRDMPEDPAEFLRWFIDHEEPPSGSGPYGLADYCHQIGTYWAAREAANVHLFHYADLWSDLEGSMRRVADVLKVTVDEDRWPRFVDAATLNSMRARARHTVPDAHLDLWVSPEGFFKAGGRRGWAQLLSADDLTHFDQRLHELAGDAADWALNGGVHRR